MAAADSQVVGMGWMSAELTKTNADGVWAALDHYVTDLQAFEEVKGVLVRDGALACACTIRDEHVGADKSKGELTFRLVDAVTGQDTGIERVIAMRTSPVRLEFFARSAGTGARVHWAAPVEPLRAMVPKLVQQAGKTHVAMGAFSRELAGATWQSLAHNMMQSFREPQKYFKCDKVVVKDISARQIYREITAFGQVLLENVYFDEGAGEAVCRFVKDGKEVDVERVTALRSSPMRFEFFQRNVASGQRVFWKMSQAVVLGDVEVWLEQAKAAAGPEAAAGLAAAGPGPGAPYTLYYHSGCKAFTGRSYGLMLMLEHGQVQYECLTPDKLPQGAACFAPPMMRFPDGRIMSQTPGIALELGKQLGLAPSGSLEASLAVQAALDASDIFGECMRNKANMDEFGSGRLQKWLLHVESLLKKTGLGFMAGAELSYADFSMYLSFSLVRMFPAAAKIPDVYPMIEAWMAKMDALPCVARIKATGVPLQPPPPPKKAASALNSFLVKKVRVDESVADFIERDLKITDVGAFAKQWGPDNFQNGLRDDVLAKQKTAGSVSDEFARLQLARLRTAWQLAQDQANWA